MARSIPPENKMDEGRDQTSGATTPSDTHSIDTTAEEKADRDAERPVPTPADSLDDVNLPYRTLADNAIMREYTHETQTGLEAVRSRVSGRPEEYQLVTFKEGDEANPKNWSKGKPTLQASRTTMKIAY